jgi:hypothetical protein
MISVLADAVILRCTRTYENGGTSGGTRDGLLGDEDKVKSDRSATVNAEYIEEAPIEYINARYEPHLNPSAVFETCICSSMHAYFL